MVAEGRGGKTTRQGSEGNTVVRYSVHRELVGQSNYGGYLQEITFWKSAVLWGIWKGMDEGVNR